AGKHLRAPGRWIAATGRTGVSVLAQSGAEGVRASVGARDIMASILAPALELTGHPQSARATGSSGHGAERIEARTRTRNGPVVVQPPTSEAPARQPCTRRAITGADRVVGRGAAVGIGDLATIRVSPACQPAVPAQSTRVIASRGDLNVTLG